MPLKKTNGLYRGKVRIGVTQDGKPIDKLYLYTPEHLEAYGCLFHL